MTLREIKWPGERISEDDLASFEQRIGLTLPAAYRAFLLAHNGGRPIPDGFPIPGGDVPDSGSLMDEFLSVAGPRTIEKCMKTFSARLPDGLLPIGRDAGGNIICMGRQGENYGRIFFWDHDFEEAAPTWDNVYPLTDTFEEFLASFRDRPKV